MTLTSSNAARTSAKVVRLTINTRQVQAALDSLYIQYGYMWRIVSEKTVFVGKECEENKWIEIVVEPDESVSGG